MDPDFSAPTGGASRPVSDVERVGESPRMEGFPPRVEFCALGPVGVIVEGQPVTLGSPKLRTVLAALLVDANSVVSSDRLIDILWGDDPPVSARATLQKLVYRLRLLVEPDRGADHLLVTRAPGYVLRVGPEEYDAARFDDRMRTARAPGGAERGVCGGGDPGRGAGAVARPGVRRVRVRRLRPRRGHPARGAARHRPRGPRRCQAHARTPRRGHRRARTDRRRAPAPGALRARSSCSRSIAPGVRSRRCAPTRITGATSSTSWASSRRPRCARSKPPWSSKHPSWTTSDLHSPRRTGPVTGWCRSRRRRYRSRSPRPRSRARSRTGSRARPRPGSTSTSWRTRSPTPCWISTVDTVTMRRERRTPRPRPRSPRCPYKGPGLLRVHRRRLLLRARTPGRRAGGTGRGRALRRGRRRLG